MYLYKYRSAATHSAESDDSTVPSTSTASTSSKADKIEDEPKAQAEDDCPSSSGTSPRGGEMTHAMRWARLSELAAENGDTRVLQWIWQLGIEFDEVVTNAAAKHGHLETLKWAIDIADCPYIDYMLVELSFDHPHIWDWLREVGIKRY